MTSGYQQNMVMEELLDDVGDSQTRMAEVINWWKTHQLIPAPHQRDFVWDEEKKTGWIKRMANTAHRPIGVLSTYQIRGEQGAVRYLNDGLQRTKTTLEFLADPNRYGYSEEIAQKVVGAYKVTLQHRHYDSHDDAYMDFRHINMGTALSPFDLCKGVLTALSDYRDVWEPILEEVHRAIREQEVRVTSSKKPTDLEIKKYRRHDYALLRRYLQEDMSLGAPYKSRIGSNKIKPSDFEAGSTVEHCLSGILSDSNASDIRKKVASFKGLVERETATIETVWEKLKRDDFHGHAYSVSRTTYRFLLDAAVWKKWNGIPYAQWEDFIFRLLKETQGSSVLTNREHNRKRATLGIDTLGRLNQVCLLIGSDMYAGKRTRKKAPRMHAGYDADHVLPFSTNGEGETVPMPASANRARGAQPLDLEGTTDE